MPELHGQYLRTEDGRHIYHLDCPGCGALGEVGVPVDSRQLFRHSDDCPVLFIQRIKSDRRGLQPSRHLETVNVEAYAHTMIDNDPNHCPTCGSDSLMYGTCACHDESFLMCGECGDYQFRTAGAQAEHPVAPEVIA